jgi:hypothetical protein
VFTDGPSTDIAISAIFLGHLDLDISKYRTLRIGSDVSDIDFTGFLGFFYHFVLIEGWVENEFQIALECFTHFCNYTNVRSASETKQW